MRLAYPRQKFQDWFTQQWAIFWGKQIEPETVTWLMGPFGKPGTIADVFVNKIAEDEGLIIERLWHFSGNQKSAEVGYDLSPKFQRKGIMNESLKRVVEFGFKELNLDLIEAYTHKKNESSKKLLERNGFTLVKDKKDEHNPGNIIYEIKKASR